MKKKLFALVAALLLVWACLLPSFALAGTRFPSLHGTVTDDTNTLSGAMVSDIEKLQTLAQSRTGVTIHVAVVHFLDGLDIQTYANQLFARWELSDNDFLLLGAVGEDAYASVSGKNVQRNFSDQNAKALLASSGFSEMFKSQQYDAAFGKYFVAFADMLGKQYGTTITLNNLFSSYQPGAQATQRPNTLQSQWSSFVSGMWGDAKDVSDSTARNYDAYHEQREREGNGLTPTGWVVLVILIMLIFGQSDPARKARKKGRVGCGCGPIGWIFGLLGLGALIGKRR